MGDDSSLFRKPHFWKIVYLAFCFLFLFTSYSIAQAFITPLHRSVGFITLALVYGFLAVTSAIAPIILNFMGLKPAMVVASLGYNAFIFCASIPSDVTEVPLLISACLVGISGACLWLAQGMYVSQIVEHTGANTKGFVVGIFFTIFCCSNIVGAALSSVMTKLGVDPYVMMRILGGVGCLASLMFCLVPKVPTILVLDKVTPSTSNSGETDPKELSSEDAANEQAVSPSQASSFAALSKKPRPVSLSAVISVPFKSRNFACLVSCFIAQGAGQVFNFAVFTALIPVSELSYVLVVFGIVGMTTSVWGKLYDRKGWKPVVYLDVAMLLSGLAVSGLIYARAEAAGGPQNLPGYWVMYLCAALLGVSNSCDFTNCGASILRVLPPAPDPQLSIAVWALYRLSQTGTSMIMLLLNLVLSFNAIVVLTAIPYLVMLIAFHFIQFPSPEFRHTRVAPEENPVDSAVGLDITKEEHVRTT